MRKDGGAGLLQVIVGDMPREHTGIEIGFLGLVDFAARSGVATAERTYERWYGRAAA